MESKQVSLRISENEQQVSENLCAFIIDVANKAIVEKGQFTVGLSGGSAAKYLSEGLQKKETDWSKWRIFFCDERHVGPDDPDSTYGFYKKNLFQHIPVLQDHIFTDDTSLSVEDAAIDYALKMKSVFGDVNIPRFDVLLLGMGPDGHTCSLFPGHPLLQEKILWIAAISDSPKPPPARITMTFPVLLNAKFAIFVACGAGKAEMVKLHANAVNCPRMLASLVWPVSEREVVDVQSWLKRVVHSTDDPPLPASVVRPTNGEVLWFLDKAAASLLSSSRLP